MQYHIDKRPSYAVLDVELAQGEQIQSKPGAMMTRSPGIETDANLGGGEGVTGLVKRAVSDERGLVDNTYTAQQNGARVTLVPEHPGDIQAFNVTETGPIKTQSGGLLAWEPLVERGTKFNERSNIFASRELTVLGLSGQGMAFISSFGSMFQEQVTPDQPIVVDEDHIVAWTEGLSLNRQKDGSLKSSIMGGEGFVTEFSGEGTVWLQTRKPTAFVSSEHDDTNPSARDVF